MADENIVNGKKYKVLQNGIWNILSFFTKASDVEFDDGMNAEEKVKDIEGIEITQAEYDALSDEEKITGVYWITDGAGGTGGSINALNVVDSLDSTATNKALSANMGRVLKENISVIQYSDTDIITALEAQFQLMEYNSTQPVYLLATETSEVSRYGTMYKLNARQGGAILIFRNENTTVQYTRKTNNTWTEETLAKVSDLGGLKLYAMSETDFTTVEEDTENGLYILYEE